jgi:hypothetical protein
MAIASPAALAGTGANVSINDGVLAVAYPIDQALLRRVDSASTGAVALGANSADALDFQASGLTNVRLSADEGIWTYSGQLTPAGNVYRFGTAYGTLKVNTSLTGARSVEISTVNGRGGVVIMGAANSYAGGTTVGTYTQLLIGSEGTTGTGAVTVNARGTFGGSGVASGGIFLENQGELSPGINGAGLLSTGALASSGGSFLLDLAGADLGTGYDQLRVTGLVSLGTASRLELTLKYTPKIGEQFTLIDNDLNDSISGRFMGFAEGAVFNLNAGKDGPTSTFRISYLGGTGNDLVLTTIPEPHSAGFLLLAAAIFGGGRLPRRAARDARPLRGVK